MRFTFPFETLLNMKKNLEELSQMRLAKKMNHLREQEEAIQRVMEEIVSNDRALKEKSEQGMKASEYLVYKIYQEDRAKDLLLKRAAMRQTKKEIEAEQKTLIQLMKERKMFERVKEKQWKKFQSQVEKLDQKNSDELVITRYRPSPNINLS
ncbi:MAG: Flagellar FliJ protein [Deltaproteobacteria bacterium]|nr:Flagellar FliJ protein [Deltaproteobacteria bacterium]